MICGRFYLQDECDGDKHPAGRHDTVAAPKQEPPPDLLDEQTLRRRRK